MDEALRDILLAPAPDYPSWPEKPVWIYGAGNAGREAARILADRGHPAGGFIDAKADAPVDEKPCLKPGSPELARLAEEGASVLIAIFNHATDTRPVVRMLSETGFQRIIGYCEFLEEFGPFESEKYWFAPRRFFRSFARELEETLDLWGDARSREIFLEAVRLRCLHDPAALSDPDRARQYFPEDVPGLPGPVRMIDGGAYTGDTLEAMTVHGIFIEAVAAFEPDPDNFQRLQATAARLGLDAGSHFPCGLGRGDETRRFRSGRGAASGFSGEGKPVRVVALDETLPRFRPTFIKLDIEGAESEALEGARVLIARHRPRLAVCIYHAPAHLWELPALIRSLTPGYQYYLRHHGFNGFDLVAYAIPDPHL
jgi:FkbM family methyltransferase